MKIYLASSLKNWIAARGLGDHIREKFGHDVYVFCDENALAFKVTTKFQMSPEYNKLDAKSALAHPLVKEIYANDRKELFSCDCVLLLLPCRKNAHMEAGIAKGLGKKVVVYGPVVQGDWDTTYLEFDEFFTTDETEQMLRWFAERSPNRNDSDGRKEQSAQATTT